MIIPNRDSAGNPINYVPAFADKKTTDGKKLYKRMHGITYACSTGDNTVEFAIPYAHVKMIGTEIINGEAGDYCDFKVLDDAEGTYSQVPNAVMNQFGYAVNIAKDSHEEKCVYDADLYVGMRIQLTYNSASAKTVGFNFDLNEVKA